MTAAAEYKPDAVLTTAEAAVVVRLAKTTLDTWRYRKRKGAPPYHKLGGSVRYVYQELQDWLKANSIEMS